MFIIAWIIIIQKERKKGTTGGTGGLVRVSRWMAPVLPDLCELDSSSDDDGEESNGHGEDYFVFHNPLSFLAVVPDVVDFERWGQTFFLFREIKRSTSLSFCLCTHKVTCVYASPRNISKKVYIFFFYYYCLAALDSFGVTRTISRKSFDWDCVTCVIFLFSYFHDFSSALFFLAFPFWWWGISALCLSLSLSAHHN